MQHFIASQNLVLVNNFSLWKKVSTLLMVKLVAGPASTWLIVACSNKMYVEAKLLKSGKLSQESPKFLVVCSNYS